MDIESAYLDSVLSQLRASNKEKNSKRCAIFSVMGAPSAGKTTLIKTLQKNIKVQHVAFYVEDASANPYLSYGFGTGRKFNADASQRWFLDQYDTFFQRYMGQSQIFLDQDPSAVGLVYSKCLRDINALTNASYLSHIDALVDFEKRMSEIATGRKIIALDAPTEVLIQRLKSRESSLSISEQWVADLNSAFRALYREIEAGGAPNFIRLDSNALSQEAIEGEALLAIGLTG